MSFILTIDDGPTVDAIGKIDYLNQSDIKSIWFCLGNNLLQNSDAAVYALNTGHVLGNHSYSHPHFSEITIAEAEAEIRSTEQLLDNIYKKAGIERRRKLFRFPYGDQGQNKDREKSESEECIKRKYELQTVLSKLGMTGLATQQYDFKEPFVNSPNDSDCLWSYDIQEWAINYDDQKYKLTKPQVLQNLNNYLKSGPFSKDQVILTHDHTATTGMFKELIDTFKQAEVDFLLPNFD